MWRKPIFLAFLMAMTAGTGGCATRVQLQVLQPAQVYVPTHIRTLAVVDRSQAANLGEGVLGVIEAAASGEEIGVDLEGRSEAVRALVGTLQSSPRFQVVIPYADPRLLESDLLDRELSWGAAQRICRQASCEGIVALEVFDSDSRITDDQKVEEYTDDKGKKRKRVIHEVERHTRVTVGWRLYDTTRSAIIDQLYDQARDNSWSQRDESRDQAYSRLPSQSQTVREISTWLGESYGRRVAPTYIQVYRKIYEKGDDRLKAGRDRVRAQDWKAAVSIWEEVAKEPDPKLRGMATYNLALAKEVEGDLDAALDLAQKAYVDLPKGRVRDYIGILQGRIADRNRLNQQMAAPRQPTPTPGAPIPPPPRRN